MLEFLYAPWRKKYVEKIHNDRHHSKRECVFCIQISSNKDDEHFILRRFDHTIVILNLYPYNPGHLLIIPHNHVQQLYHLDKAARTELIEIISQVSYIAKKVQEADGINIGLNLEKAAGAGIPEHMHIHMLPRFNGDTNFLPLLSNTKHISLNLSELYESLKPHIQAITL